MLELHKFQHEKPAKNDPIKGNYQWFEKTFWILYYKYKDRFYRSMVFDIIVDEMNFIQWNCNSPVGKI